MEEVEWAADEGDGVDGVVVPLVEDIDAAAMEGDGVDGLVRVTVGV